MPYITYDIVLPLPTLRLRASVMLMATQRRMHAIFDVPCLPGLVISATTVTLRARGGLMLPRFYYHAVSPIFRRQ